MAATLLAVCVGVSGTGAGIDRSILEIGWHLRDRPASGQLVLVEMDARSIAKIDHWPWPRRHYAQVVDRLHAAGARSITFDVDFSSPSSPLDDHAFAQALERAGGTVALPTFSQAAGSGNDAVSESLPIPPLASHAALAAVSVLPDKDGIVRRMPLGITTAGLPRPSLSALIAGVNGAAEADFPVNYAIDPATIPRLSFVDIRDGRFDPAAIRGKHILIGATAIELGDRYAAPQRGVLPGVVIQALAAETLFSGVPRESGWPLPLALALAGCALILRARSRARLFTALAVIPGSLVATAVVVELLWNWAFALAPALAALLFCGACAIGMGIAASTRRRRRHDGVTGLPNRLALEEALQTYPAAGVFAVMIVEFERLAAALGAPATATLVRRVRDRVAMVAGEVTVYRLDERLMAWRCQDGNDSERQVATLRSLMLSPIDVGGRRVDVSLAVGFAAEAETGSSGLIIENAALAAATALSDGSGWHVHHATDSDAVNRELSLLGELDEAIADGDIEIAYQPKLELASRRITSVEALVRWNHPLRGSVRPDQFIPLAERSGRIAGLTLYVLRLAIADLRRWHAQGHAMTSAVNISATLLNSREFIEAVRSLVEDSGISPTWLTLEVTESAAMSDPEGAVEALRQFRDMGMSISMDDYGTGMSTLSYIRQLPLSELKIDRSFVQFAHQNRGDGAMVRSTVDLAHELGLKVVAEGVEDEECLEFLSGIGCDMVQGYLISRPIPASELELLLRQYRAAA